MTRDVSPGTLAVSPARTVADQMAVAIVSADDSIPGLEASLRAHADCGKILAELARAPEPLVRMWALGKAPDILGIGAVSILRDRLADGDNDVRSLAWEGMVRLDPGQMRRELGRLRRALRSDDYDHAIDALWVIAELGASELIPEIKRASANWQPWRRRTAEMLIAVLDGDEASIVERIRGHDHVDMARLCRAATLISSPAADEALAGVVADSAVDDHCRDWARRALSRDIRAR